MSPHGSPERDAATPGLFSSPECKKILSPLDLQALVIQLSGLSPLGCCAVCSSGQLGFVSAPAR